VHQEVIVEPRELSVREVRAIDDLDFVCAQFLAQFVEARLLFGGELRRLFAHARQLIGGRHPVLGEDIHALSHLTAQARDPDHEELVEVVGRDRQETQLLEQRMIGVRGFQQDATIEFKPRQFAVHEPVGQRQRIGGNSLRGRRLCGLGQHGRLVCLSRHDTHSPASLRPRSRHLITAG
jgi:hypothetical protein